MLYQIIIIIHIFLGIGIVGLVLMQQGKGADAGATFGGGASGSVFGAQGSASFLSRTTAIFATLFFITSLGLAVLSGYQGKKTDVILDSTPVAEPVKSDVPLTQGMPADGSLPIQDAKLPEAPAIKEVEKPAAK
ncbi:MULTISPECIES: preprotein translocase subunit SecG [Methylomonas]|uniref:Protein-export membrane protein SecG n=2 Tax=Methylomonas TaxID=416 RepID=A0A126T141_9GAMM|nr:MULTISPECIES: preprotein translocase subunit SecG [Methylomonas]AMK75797.1 preprotein translocase subunit SecG [Methylomonas denitrificans]OAH98552.1 preprotein translocase subunit SecG [Methylomonas methanica]TCV80154.1 protein translocase subunit secG [Methylomonas methanica]